MKYLSLIVLVLLLSACEDETFIPKPPTYLETELPEHDYVLHEDSCGYQFDIQKFFTIENAGATCNRKIDLGQMNGTIYAYYWEMEKPLSFYVNNANDEVGNHKLKATSINDTRIIRPESNVFGTMFELQGDVATPFQFYLTDSTTKFFYAEVLFNSTPNYDSLKPTLDYLKLDINKMIESFEWE